LPPEPTFGNVVVPLESFDVDESEDPPLLDDELLLVDDLVWVPAVESWCANAATATTPTTLTAASPAVTVVARVNAASRCMGASCCRSR